ncbi:hypothetical protein [Actinoplanes nipponensis]|nr:hypothetical protein [Actinoplanes nipponensis]
MRIAAFCAAVTIVSVGAGSAPAVADPAPAPPAAAPGATLSRPVAAPAGKQLCAAVTAHPRKFIRAGETQAGCAVAATTAAAAAVAPVSCQDQTTGTWHYRRTSVCLAGYQRSLQTVDAAGKVTGTATIEISTDMPFQTERLTWTENWYLTLTAATGRLTTMGLTWSVACGTGCAARSTPAGAQQVTVGATVSGTTTYTANPAGRSEWTQTYSLAATNPSGDTLPVQSYPGYYPFRCDRVIGPNPGCVVPAVTMSLAMSKSGAERSVQAAWLLQRDFPDNWGAGAKLHRQMDSTLAQANYDAVCNDGTFVKSGTSDTCVLFPPASTYETARLLGLSAGDCVDATARQSRGTGQWYLDYAAGTVDFTERCLRAHAPDTEAAEFQRQLNGFYQGQRILDNDAFGLVFSG